MSSQNLSMEIVYTRKKSRMTFKGIVNKVIISAMVLGCVIGGASPAFAAGNYDADNYNFTIQSEVSSEAILAEIQNTINAVKENISNGAVSTQYLEQLASQINRLNSAASSTNRTTISNLLNEAEGVAKRISNASAIKVQAAIAAARVNLGLDQVDAITAADQSLNLNSNKKAETISVQATNRTATSFTDVETTQWYYNPIMQCVEKGLMQGMGDGKFSPTTQMTVAQFITVAVNASYSSELAKQPDGGNWWNKAYNVAVEKGLITASEYANKPDVMNAPITRKEMARIASRVTVAKGEGTQTLTSTSVIADYNSIGGTYKSFVVDCFAKGILQGTDNKGTFNPDGVLTRAEACTVALKLVDPSTRTPLKGATNVDTTPVASNGTEYREGQSRTNLPQAGDVIIKADGTKVTLQYGPGGVLGAGQGVDIYSGIQIKGQTIEIGTVVSAIGQTPLKKDPITGEVHTKADWTKIRNSELNPVGSYRGTYDGEIYNTWWQWDAGFGDWTWIAPN